MIEVLEEIPLTMEAENVMKLLRLPGGDPSMEGAMRELVETALRVARPKALYAVSPVNNRNGDSLDIDGVTFSSRVVSVNLEDVNRVFPFVATCGREVDEIPLPKDDLMADYCADTVKMLILAAAMAHLEDQLTRRFQLGKISHMSPGSLENWPLTAQKPLFSLMGDVEGAIGVTLTDSMLMVPTKSVSGLFFQTESGFENCQLCPMENCPGRRAPRDPELMAKYDL